MPEISDEELEEYQRLKDDNAARDLYGEAAHGGGTPGGAAPHGGRPNDVEKFIGDFQQRFDDPSGQISVNEVSRYARTLGGAHLLHNMAEVSQIFRRHGITPEVVDRYEKGQLRQNRPQKAGVGLPPRG